MADVSPQLEHVRRRFWTIDFMCAPVAQLDRASDYGSEGWGFEFLQAHGKQTRRKQRATARNPDRKVGVFCHWSMNYCALKNDEPPSAEAQSVYLQYFVT
jgi:hypothetical protein